MTPKVKVRDLYAVSTITGVPYKGHFWEDTKQDLCPYCQKRMKRSNIDHIYPRIRGGENKWWNKIRACYGCNQKKGSRQLLNFLMRTWGKDEPTSTTV